MAGQDATVHGGRTCTPAAGTTLARATCGSSLWRRRKEVPLPELSDLCPSTRVTLRLPAYSRSLLVGSLAAALCGCGEEERSARALEPLVIAHIAQVGPQRVQALMVENNCR